MLMVAIFGMERGRAHRLRVHTDNSSNVGPIGSAKHREFPTSACPLTVYPTLLDHQFREKIHHTIIVRCRLAVDLVSGWHIHHRQNMGRMEGAWTMLVLICVTRALATFQGAGRPRIYCLLNEDVWPRYSLSVPFEGGNIQTVRRSDSPPPFEDIIDGGGVPTSRHIFQLEVQQRRPLESENP